MSRPTLALMAAGLGLLLGASGAAVTVAAPAAPAPVVLERPPLITAKPGPAGGPWEHCEILLEGKEWGPAPLLISSLCFVDGKPVVAQIAAAPPKARALSVEAGPSGSLRILVGRPGGVDQFELEAPGAVPRATTLLADERLNPLSLDDRPDIDGDGTFDLVQSTYTGVLMWRRNAEGRMTALREASIAPDAYARGETLQLLGATVFAPTPPAPVRWTSPDHFRGRRFRTFRIPLTAGGAGEVCEAWVDSTQSFWVQSGVFLSGDPPKFAALVAPADKVSLFGNEMLLVGPLVCDPTARGRTPSLVVKTDFDMVTGPKLSARDVDGDGRVDLVVEGRKGVLSSKFQLAVYYGLPDGSFRQQPALLVAPDAEPEATRWDRDVDGDGSADLVILTATEVVLLRGTSARGAQIVPLDPGKPERVALPENLEDLELVDVLDLDGDRKAEALVAATIGEPRNEKKKKGAQPAEASAAATSKGENASRLIIVKF